MKADTPIELADLTKLSPDERDTLLEQIRERRLRPVRVYEETLRLREAAKRAKIEIVFDKQILMFEKDLARADKAMTKVEERLVKLRGLQLELEDD